MLSITVIVAIQLVFTNPVTYQGHREGVSLGSGNPLQVQYITQLGEVTPVILQMI